MSVSDSSTPIPYTIGRRTSVIFASAFSAVLSITMAVSAAAGPKAPAWANAKMFGFVFNPNGDAINGATVSLLATENGESYIVYTSGNGQFRIDDIIPGTYNLTITARGFDTTNVPNVVVRAGDNNRMDQTLSMDSSGEEARPVVPSSINNAVATPSNPLVVAARDDDLEKVKTLLLSKPDVNARDESSHYTALEGAVMNGNREMMQVLLWNKADVNLRDDRVKRF